MHAQTSAPRRSTAFRQSEEGSATILMLFFCLIFIVLGGLAIDFNKVMSDRTQLQIIADTAAHSALYARETKSESEAVDEALRVATTMTAPRQYAGSLRAEDIQFGTWSFLTDSFVADANSRSAVEVKVAMNETRGNASRNLLLNIIGVDSFDVVSASVYSTYYPPCFTEGFVAEDVVDIQSNNAFTDGFCLHSNNYVSLNSNNYFEPGTVVSMPNLDDLDIPKSGFEKNEGLATALRMGEYRLRILNKLPLIIEGLRTGDPLYLPKFLYGNAIHSLSGLGAEPITAGKVTPLHFVIGQVNTYLCNAGGKLTLEAGLYEDMVFVTNCEVKFSSGVQLEDVIVATTSTSATSLNSPSGLSIGRDDNCATGGGATLLTLGGFNAAASLNVFGGQILALGDIEFAANADGIQGASFVSNGRIDGTSNMNMGFCQYNGMENAFRASYFRMVE
ncbi:TadE/TadG family type IV pilus assembly protein [Sulfitobacter sabulilitoris]|uniref:Uncharacterized protein n=1 Tax=Sulfitobacter sabulilitoris TaxID=2562655 RepID=A0A5S3QD60_9RHOB|nr:TadE/TadG family type IV pilus assembly protein [Sulfitobacter sabulilitoris]TMM55102.1 hypothetical protein FDT80_05915 [Sulfitobacter sabulilitoris]